MKRRVSFLLAVILFLSGCGQTQQETEKKQYTATFLTLFDTVTTIVGKAENEESFQQEAQAVHDQLQEYHQLFDIYQEYEGIANLKTINDKAGIEPVKVDSRIISLLQDCRKIYEVTEGKVNVAMGSVLALWHEARDYGRNNPKEAKLPGKEELDEAAQHVDFEKIIIDEKNSTVYIEDPRIRLDVGAIAKGWSVQQVAEKTREGLLLSVGGNVCATGPKDEKGNPWVVGVENPEGEGDYLHTLYLTKGSIITSGDYQRTYQVEGKMYHHIIDSQTLFPADYWRSVTVLCDDSGIGDALSTALFVMSKEKGQQLLEEYNAEAMWVDGEGKIYYSPGFKKQIRT